MMRLRLLFDVHDGAFEIPPYDWRIELAGIYQHKGVDFRIAWQISQLQNKPRGRCLFVIKASWESEFERRSDLDPFNPGDQVQIFTTFNSSISTSVTGATSLAP